MIAPLAYADLAHLVERRLAKAKVAGSSPVIRSIKSKDTQMGVFVFYCASYVARTRAKRSFAKGKFAKGKLGFLPLAAKSLEHPVVSRVCEAS